MPPQATFQGVVHVADHFGHLVHHDHDHHGVGGYHPAQARVAFQFGSSEALLNLLARGECRRSGG
jgi:hypothetical protein